MAKGTSANMQPVSAKSSTATQPHIQPKHPLLLRALYFFQVWAIKIAILCFFKVLKRFKPTPIEQGPTLIKSYPSHPELRHRVFLPKSYKDGRKLPLYLNAHGGGNILLPAEFDDEVCAQFAKRFNMVVVSIEFHLAPLYKFPTQINEVVAIAQAVIDDPLLPVDKGRVVLGGFSAGGELMMSAAQIPELRNKVKGVVAWYPPMDSTIPLSERQASRPYRHAKDIDDMQTWGTVFAYASIPPGQDLKDPLVSPRYAKAKDLPKWIYLIGAEYDMMADEARQTAFDLAGLNEKEREEGKYEFEKGTYKWTLVKGVRHAFTHDTMEKPGPDETMRIERHEEMVQKVGEWLRGVLSL